MKNIVVILMTFIFNKANAQSKIVANITNFESDKGVCRVCLFNSEAAFKGETGEPFQCATLQVKSKSASAVFQDVPAGNYALFVFHDENNNNKMDKNFLGIPKEGYGASKNKLPFAAAPTFADNKFVVENKTTTTLNVKLRNIY